MAIGACLHIYIRHTKINISNIHVNSYTCAINKRFVNNNMKKLIVTNNASTMILRYYNIIQISIHLKS